MKNILKQKYIYILAFIIPWIIITINALCNHGWPFFEGSILRGDAGYQHYQLYVELWNKIHYGRSLLFSWNAGDGYDFCLNMMYYLISPFTLMIVAVPRSWLMNTVQVVMVLKWSLIFVSIVYYYMHTEFNTLTKNKKTVSFVLGAIYALSNCIITRLNYFNWSDVIILFPLILLCLEKMVREGKWKTYTLLLWLAIVCNFYIAYQICIFLIIWFVLLLNAETDHKIKKFLIFAGSSLLSAFSAAAVILPSIVGGLSRFSGIDASSNYVNNANYRKQIFVDLWEFIRKFFIFDRTSDVMSFAPNMYFSIGAMIIAALYLGTKSKLRIKNTVAAILLLCGLFFGGISYVWHGFNAPHGVYHRFLYLIIFMFTFIVLDVIKNFQDISWKKSLLIGIAFIALLVASFLKNDYFLGYYVYLTTMILVIFYFAVLVLYFKGSININYLMVVFSVAILLELCANSYYQLKVYVYPPMAETYCVDEIDTLMDQADIKEGERVQVEQGVINNGAMFDFPGNDIFMSYCNGEDVKLHSGFGMDFIDDASYSMYGASPLLNLIFNMRYGIADNEIYFSDTDMISGKGELNLYRTRRLAGLGYMVDTDILDWGGAYDGPYESQNNFARCATGYGDLFEIIHPDLKCYVGHSEIEPIQKYTDSGYYYYQYTTNMPEEYEFTRIDFTADKDMDLYITANSGLKAYSVVLVDGETVLVDTTDHRQQTFHVGNVKKGQEVEVYANHSAEIGEENAMWYHFADFNDEAYSRVYNILSKNIYDIEYMKDDHVKGRIHADEDGIMMTSIQALEGFTVFVDGQKTDHNIVGAFIGVPLSAGEHVVEFRYRTPYLFEGTVISGVGILLYLLICVLTGIRKKRNKKRGS